MKQGKKEIALCTFQNRVSPRFDLPREIFIYNNQEPEKGPVEKIDATALSPEDCFSILVKRKVRVVIVGGMQERYQAMFLNNEIKVIWGVIGEVNDVIAAYIRDTLYPDIGRVSDQWP